MKKVLFLCPNLWDEEALASGVAGDTEIIFDARALYEDPAALEDPELDVFRYVDALADKYRDAGLAGVVGTGDYPASLLAPALAQRLGLRTPPLAAVLAFTHKYHSRVVQARLVPEATPAFEALEPLSAQRPSLPFPFFVKPVKGTMSIRARMVRDAADLEAAVHYSPGEQRSKRAQFRLFEQLLAPHGMGELSTLAFVAEAPLQGVQVTVDGFVENGRAVIMGIVDSIMYPGTMSFQRFDYPSGLPEGVQARMRSIATRLMEGSGFDQSCFNIEFFYDAERDAVQLIEVNPRMSYQFSDLYQRVDGVHTHALQLALATGAPSGWKRGGGRDRVASSFVLRTFEDRHVARSPTDEEIAAVRARFPGTLVKPMCRQGDRLSHHDQDVGSFRYCIINMGARDSAALHADFQAAMEMLPFVLEP